MTMQGKYAEGVVRVFLNNWKSEHAGFTFNRILDAHSARGAMTNPQPGDFQWFLNTGQIATWMGSDGKGGMTEFKVPYTRNGLIEVKETLSADRLPYKNFSVDQVGRMRIRALAGSETLILTCHRTPTLGNRWRAVPLSFFEVRDPSTPYGSWVLSDFPTHKKVNTILEEYLK